MPYRGNGRSWIGHRAPATQAVRQPPHVECRGMSRIRDVSYDRLYCLPLLPVASEQKPARGLLAADRRNADRHDFWTLAHCLWSVLFKRRCDCIPFVAYGIIDGGSSRLVGSLSVRAALQQKAQHVQVAGLRRKH